MTERQITSTAVTLTLHNKADDDEHFIQFHARADSGTVEISFPNFRPHDTQEDQEAAIVLDMEDFCDAVQGFIAQCAALPPVRPKGAPR